MPTKAWREKICPWTMLDTKKFWGLAPLPFESIPFSPFFILMNDTWQRSNLTIRKTPTQSLYLSNLLSLTAPLFSANYRHHLSMRDPSMEALLNTRFQRKSNPVPLSSLDFLPRKTRIKKKNKKKKNYCENNFPNLWILIIVKYNGIKIRKQYQYQFIWII